MMSITRNGNGKNTQGILFASRPAQTRLKSEWWDIGPELASLLLEKNHPKNKERLNDSVVMKYAADMRAGAWDVTHQGILLGKDDVLLDGQHRLGAIVLSGVTVPVHVTMDPQRETPLDLAIDCGFTRRAAWVNDLPRAVSDVANRIYALITGAKSVSLAQNRAMADKVLPVWDAIAEMMGCGWQTVKIIGSSSVRSAVVIWGARFRRLGDERELHTLAKDYRAMLDKTGVGVEFSCRRRAGFRKQTLLWQAQNRCPQHDELLARSWKCLDPYGDLDVAYTKIFDKGETMSAVRKMAREEFFS